MKYPPHWRIQEGAPPACVPPNRINFFHFHIRFCQKVYASEVSAPPTGNPGSATAPGLSLLLPLPTEEEPWVTTKLVPLHHPRIINHLSILTKSIY